MSPSIDIPAELLDRIFTFYEQKEPKSFGFAFNRDPFVPKFNFYPLLFVCKLWHDVAERRLYDSISLGDVYEGDKVDSDYEDEDERRILEQIFQVVKRLVKTLEGNNCLALLVHKLTLPTRLRSYEESMDQCQLIRLCKNVKHVDLLGYSDGTQEEFMNALRTASCLVSLTLSPSKRCKMEAGSFCSPAQLMKLMASWPEIESVSCRGCALEYDGDDVVLADLEGIKDACSHLREFTVEGDVDCIIGAASVIALTAMTGRLETIDIVVDDQPESNEAINACLRKSASTLVHVSLRLPKSASLAGALSQLSKLRNLGISSKAIAPSAIPLLKNLERLKYSFHCVADVEKLVEILQDESVLSKLIVICVWNTIYNILFRWTSEYVFKIDSKEGASLCEVCSSRNIQLVLDFSWWF